MPMQAWPRLQAHACREPESNHVVAIALLEANPEDKHQPPATFWVQIRSKNGQFSLLIWDPTPRGGDDRSLLFPQGKSCDLPEFPSKHMREIEHNLMKCFAGTTTPMAEAK